jgi:hypothetical protein
MGVSLFKLGYFISVDTAVQILSIPYRGAIFTEFCCPGILGLPGVSYSSCSSRFANCCSTWLNMDMYAPQSSI